MKTLLVVLALFFASTFELLGQEIVSLYSGPVPNSKNSEIKETGGGQSSGVFAGVTHPTLEIYLPEKGKSTGAGVIICPGGGYGVVVYEAEGIRTAKEFAKNGVAAFVLKYRIPNDSTMVDKKIGPLQDAQQAIRIVREHCSEWRIDKNKVGIMGFSAGGHLASTVATHFRRAYIENNDSTNLRPDYQILIYPVISMQESLTHRGSRMNLLGANPSKETVDQFSNELQVDENSPPAYITQAEDDNVVDVDNSIIYFEKLKQHKVPAELHIYPKGNHGFVLFQPTEEWMMPILKWMKKSQWINN